MKGTIMEPQDKRIGVISIVVRDRAMSNRVNEILSRYGESVCGRIGVPFRDRGFSVISVLVDADPAKIGAVSGSLGNIPGVTLRSVMLT